LEEILIDCEFNFTKAARALSKMLNTNPEFNREGTEKNYWKIEAKTLQLKWTDIEVRRHVIPSHAVRSNQSEDNEELPAMSKAASPETEETRDT
jgi:hypothetical protein